MTPDRTEWPGMSVDPTRADIYDLPPEHVRQPWCEWLEFHTVDPRRVAVPGRIDRLVGARQVAYLAYKRDELDRIILEQGSVAYVIEVVQLEARPLPFPEPCGTSSR